MKITDMINMNYDNLIQPIIERARSHPDHKTLIFWGEDDKKEIITARDFHINAVAYAQALKAIGIQQDDLVILVLRHSKTLLFAFWGALYMGAIASIFPFLTEKLDPEIYMERVKALVAHSKAKAVITFPEFKEELSALLADVNCKVISSAEVATNTNLNNDIETVYKNHEKEKIAFLQHSSGTTGLQKGVALSHRAVLNQIESYSQSLNLTSEDVIISWLPLYHDMGLIAGFVMPIVAGVTMVMMSPFHWVRDPKILMQAVTEYKGTLCWLPNFAYNHSVRGIRKRDLEGLDLSTLRAVINCSEPVRNDSHHMFLERFSPFGFREDALATCYAMAENTFAVTQSPLGAPPHIDWVEINSLQTKQFALPAAAGENGATPMVSCGFPIPNVEVAIINNKNEILPDRNVGEIILRSNCMLSGYYHRPDATAEAIIDGWYHTGDMGYIADGQVYISGRKKDMIIVGGKNVFPQDLEAIANTTPGLHPGRSAAFGMMDEQLGSEVIVMVCELENENASEEEKIQIERDLRRRVVQQTEVALADIRLVGSKWLIKTSSGKTARSANRDKYLKEFLNKQ
jgi:acyl-CoA synthetase (AMP-forming)/AMP-acid ligase II